MIDWKWLEQCQKWMYGLDVVMDEVLVEYDGPHLALFRDENDKQYFGIFCDFAAENYRWMLAQISGAESIAIQTGSTKLIEVFKKRTIWFCDFDNLYRSKTVWHVGFEQIPSIIMPKSGQPLPLFAQKPITSFVDLKDTTAIIKLDGKRVVQNSLPFRELGRFLVQFQEYWDRLSRSAITKLLPESPGADPRSFASLSFCAASEGSVNIHFKPTAELENGKKLLASTLDKFSSLDDTGIPLKLTTELGSHGLRNANQMYSLMHSAGIDMLLVTEDRNIFVGAEKAGRLARIIKKSEKAKSENLILRGHFCAGRSKKNTHTFEFVDELSGNSYKGKVSPLVWRYTSIAVGKSDYYEVEIETFEKKKDNQPIDFTYLLARADRIKRPQILEDEFQPTR